MVKFSLSHLKRLEVVVGGICVRGKNNFPLVEGRWGEDSFYVEGDRRGVIR